MSLPFLSTPLRVPFFRCESSPYISRRADWFPCPLNFVSLSFPLHPLVFISVPFMSLSCPFQFPFVSLSFPLAFLSASYFLPSFPCTSLHFPFAPQYFPQKTRFSSVFAKRTSNDTEFSRFSAKGGRSRGIQAWDPCFATPAPGRLRLVERHQITARYAGDPPQTLHIRRRVEA